MVHNHQADANRGDDLAPPPNPTTERTLIIDGRDSACYPRPSAALTVTDSPLADIGR